jgi:drug/metabolite transporter (DMT)-like permease
MLALLCAIWGMTFPATRAALATADPVHFMALRFTLATVVATPILLLRRSGGSAVNRVGASGWLMGAGVGVLLLAGLALQTFGMRYTTASRSGFFTGLVVVMAPLLAVILRTSRLPAGGWLSVPVALAGIYLLADPAVGGLNRGDRLTIGCALACALQMVALEAAARRVKDDWLLTYAQIAVVAVGTLLWSLLTGVPFRASPIVWLAAGYTAVFGGVIAVWMQTRYQPMVPAGHAALIFTLEPVFAGIFAWLLLGEGWTLRGLAGAGLILMAMAGASLGLKKTTKSTKNTETDEESRFKNQESRMGNG